MAHKLNRNGNGKYAFASSTTIQEKAWHGLGQYFGRQMTSREAIEQAMLDFTVAKEQVMIEIPGKGLTEVPGRFGTYRTDNGTPFGVVGSRYEIVQNRDAFEFFDAITGGGEAIIETAGALYNGEVVFITAKLPDYIKVGKDEIEKYIFLQSTHDGSGSIIAAFTSTRIVCSNTLSAALGNMTNKVSIRHTKDAVQKLREAHKIMGLSNLLSNELETVFNKMAKVQITDAHLRKLIEQIMLPAKKEELTDAQKAEISTRSMNKINSIFEYAMSSPTQQTESTKGTLYGFLNSVTGYYQNVKDWKTADDKFDSITNGKAQEDSQKALNLALTLI